MVRKVRVIILLNIEILTGPLAIIGNPVPLPVSAATPASASLQNMQPHQQAFQAPPQQQFQQDVKPAHLGRTPSFWCL
jgi:hypothetical protein